MWSLTQKIHKNLGSLLAHSVRVSSPQSNNKTLACIRYYSQSVWRTLLFFSFSHQDEDTPSECVGVKDPLGWWPTWDNAKMHGVSVRVTYSKMLFFQRFLRHIHGVAWILWCIRVSVLCHCCRFTNSTGRTKDLWLPPNKVTPLRRLSIPHLELCGAPLLSQPLHH